MDLSNYSGSRELPLMLSPAHGPPPTCAGACLNGATPKLNAAWLATKIESAASQFSRCAGNTQVIVVLFKSPTEKIT